MRIYKTPGVYPEEVSSLLPSVVALDTAIPAFIGYTEKRPSNSVEAYKISSMAEYLALFGGPFPEPFPNVEVGKAGDFFEVNQLPSAPAQPTYWLYYQLQMFFANGGGACYIVSVKTYGSGVDKADLDKGINALMKEDEPTLILIPDAIGVLPANPNDISLSNYYGLYKNALSQCASMKDRFAIIDIHKGTEELSATNTAIADFRNKIGSNFLSYGATYFPWLHTTLEYHYEESRIAIAGADLPQADIKLKYDTSSLSALPDDPDGDGTPFPDEDAKRNHYESRSLYHLDNQAYRRIKTELDSFQVTLPPSGAIAGIYARVDSSRGVFKAPANVSLNNVARPAVKVSNEKQEGLNLHPTGKSINAIRSFTGKGVMVWGARTLDGNSNEWRYISVRRLFIFLEESISKAIERFVFEPNDEGTWVKVKGTIENFLGDQWRAGALAGNTAKQAFFVHAGLGITMTPQDILEGRLVVDVGVAAVRPAEFIVLRFSHKLQEG
ncbi:MAG: phage tail sheath family protein [Lewinellaceae bacterium]|nr:phage tail sheath family protein [Lewinellaceae bacterium]